MTRHRKQSAAACRAKPGDTKLEALLAAFIKELQGQLSPPTVKQHLAALRCA